MWYVQPAFRRSVECKFPSPLKVYLRRRNFSYLPSIRFICRACFSCITAKEKKKYIVTRLFSGHRDTWKKKSNGDQNLYEGDIQSALLFSQRHTEAKYWTLVVTVPNHEPFFFVFRALTFFHVLHVDPTIVEEWTHKQENLASCNVILLPTVSPLPQAFTSLLLYLQYV